MNNNAGMQAIERYAKVSRELASLFRERGDMLAEQANTRVSAYQQAVVEGQNVSTARHLADLAVDYHTQEIAKLNGEIDAFTIELRYLDQLLQFVANMSDNIKEQTDA